MSPMWGPRNTEHKQKAKVTGSEPEPQQAGSKPPCATHSAVLPEHRRLCCGLPRSVWAGVTKHSKRGRMSSEEPAAPLPAPRVSVSLHLVFCCVALPTGWTAGAPCPGRPSWVPASCVTTGPPLPRRHHGDSHRACQVVGKVLPGQMWELVSCPPHPLPLAPARETPIWELGGSLQGTQD